MRRTLGHSHAFWLGLLIWLAGAATAVNASVTYDYQGSDFTSIVPTICPTNGSSCAPAFTKNESITGDIVFANSLPPSVLGNFIENPPYQSFSFTDGVNTITNTTPGVDVTGSGFLTNASGNILQGNFAVVVTGANGYDLRMGHRRPPRRHFTVYIPRASRDCLWPYRS
jgi:hypothetical protein